MKEFDKLEEKVGQMVKTVQELKSENKKLKEEIAGMNRDYSDREQEKEAIKSKISTLLELVESIEE